MTTSTAKRGQKDPTELSADQQSEEPEKPTVYVGVENPTTYFISEDQRLGGNGKPVLNEATVDDDLAAEYRDLKGEWDAMQSKLQSVWSSSTTPEEKEEEVKAAEEEMAGKEATELTKAQQAEAKASESSVQPTPAKSAAKS